MKFGQALAAMLQGRKVKRDAWVNDGVHYWPFWYIPPKDSPLVLPTTTSPPLLDI